MALLRVALVPLLVIGQTVEHPGPPDSDLFGPLLAAVRRLGGGAARRARARGARAAAPDRAAGAFRAARGPARDRRPDLHLGRPVLRGAAGVLRAPARRRVPPAAGADRRVDGGGDRGLRRCSRSRIRPPARTSTRSSRTRSTWPGPGRARSCCRPCWASAIDGSAPPPTSAAGCVAQALTAEDRERQRLAELLHDDAIQNLLLARQELRDHHRRHDEDSYRRADERARDHGRSAARRDLRAAPLRPGPRRACERRSPRTPRAPRAAPARAPTSRSTTPR